MEKGCPFDEILSVSFPDFQREDTLFPVFLQILSTLYSVTKYAMLIKKRNCVETFPGSVRLETCASAPD